MMRKQVFIAYDENLSMMLSQGKCKGAESIGTSIIPNWQLDSLSLLGLDISTINPQSNSKIWVTAWRVTLSDVVELDNYYCYPVLRTKIPISAIINNKRVDGFTYVLNNNFYMFSRAKPLAVVKKKIKKVYDNYHLYDDWPTEMF